VTVQNRVIPISQVTEEDLKNMTPEEYQDYFSKLALGTEDIW
jgi:hypothetical protein